MAPRIRKTGRMIALALLAAGCRRGERPEAATATTPAFRDPASAAMREQAPATFRARFETTKGDFVIEVQRDWAPLGADRFYNLVRSGYYDGVRFFRVISGFMAQFGIHGDPLVSAVWRDQQIPDDSVRQSNTRGMVSFATAGPNTRTTQLFINYGDNIRLDDTGFAPFGRVEEGMDVVDRLYAEYGEGAPRGRGPNQGRIQAEGNAYLKRDFPKLDFIRRATILTP
jgi:cyclophilin family peptidyl-prolyl cis-trans isomerase